jgi:hypothetical protein
MPVIVLVLATAILLLGSGFLMSTVGRRRPRPRALAAAELAAIEGNVGRALALLVGDAAQLRARAQDVGEIGREMLVVERHLNPGTQRPLWRQIDDANFSHELDGLRQAARAWLQQLDALDVTERQLLERLALGVEPVRTLARDRSWTSLSVDRRDELTLVQAQLVAAITCLHKLEREISSYRGGGYR